MYNIYFGYISNYLQIVTVKNEESVLLGFSNSITHLVSKVRNEFSVNNQHSTSR